MSTGYERSSIKLDSNNEEKGALTNEESKQEDNEIARNDDNNTYTIQEMTPDMVHYGCVPELVLVEEVENVRRMVDSEMAGSNDAEMLRNLTRVCSNGELFLLGTFTCKLLGSLSHLILVTLKP